MEGIDELPTQFDVVVVGTGMVESIVAAGCSRIGKTVLHLDRNTYYGDFWATFGLESLEEFAKAYGELDKINEVAEKAKSESNDEIIHPILLNDVISNLAFKWFIPLSKPNTPPIEENLKEKDNNSLPSSETDVLNKDNSQEKDNKNEINSKEEDNKVKTTEDNQDIVEEIESKEKEDEKEILSKKKTDTTLWSVQEMRDQSRKFNIDLAPKVIYSTGSMVDLLLRSCVYRYTEFQSVSQILARVKNSGDSGAKLEKVPCTKSDVFSNRSVSVIDKRILMKVLNFCLNFTESTPEYEELKDQLFLDYLKRERVPDHLIQYIFYSIAMATGQTRFMDAAKRVQCFLKNVGRYGNSPFLWPLYGSGELLQAFCRLSAVYGGVYYLGRGADAVVVSTESNLCKGIVSNSKHIQANHVVTSSYFCPKDFLQDSKSSNSCIKRTILFTDRPLYPSNKDEIAILHFPTKDESAPSPIVLLELPSMTGTCPKGLYVIHITYNQSQEDSGEVKDLIDELFIKKPCQADEELLTDDLSEQLIGRMSECKFKQWLQQQPPKQVELDDISRDKPNILYAFYFEVRDSCIFNISSKKPENLHFCHGPDASIDFDRAIKQAREIFAQMYPSEEFLEPTPDPNEITLSDLMGEENQKEQNQNESDQTDCNIPNESINEISNENIDKCESTIDSTVTTSGEKSSLIEKSSDIPSETNENISSVLITDK